MADSNKLDVTINVKMNGSEALGQLSEIKSTVSGIGSSVSKDFSQISSSATSSGNSLKTAFSNGLSGVSEKVRGISEAFSGLNGVMSSVMGTIGLGSFKSLTLDMAMTRDQAKNLLAVTMQGSQTFAQASQTADNFINKIREGTSGSVVKLQMMIEAMNGIKLSTGMANSDLESLNDVIRKVGEASLLMGDDTSHATFVMKEAMSGLNGDFQTLKEQFGITAEKMKEAGWSGAADDVQGYRQALEQCLSGLGDMGQVMDTTSGKINKIKSNFSSAGLEIGNSMLPAVDWVASAFLDANENGNLLAKGILYAGGAASAFASLAPTLKPMFDTYDSIKGAVEKAKGATELLTKATETMDGVTAALTGTKAAETVATEADAVAETTDAAAKSANTVATEADAAANVTLTGALTGAASSAWALTVALLKNPLTWVAIAVIALVAVMWHLYNTNEEVRNGLNDIWNIISGGLGAAWNALSGAVTAFANALVPVVMAIINFVKWFALLFTDFPAAQQQFSDFINNIGNIVLQGLANIGMMIVNAFLSIPMSLAATFMAVIMNIQNWLTQARMIAGMLVGMLVQWVVTRFNVLVARVRNIFTMVVNAIRSRLSNARTIATNLAQMIRQQIVNKFNQIIARVRTIFQNIVSTIRSRLSNAVSAARQKAQEILQGIKDKVTNIPQIVADEFNKIKDRISSALSSAASAAASGAAGIVNAFKSALGIASPGYVQRMTAAEFATLPLHIADSGVRAVDETTKMARGIVNAWSGNMTSLGVNWEDNLNSGIPQFNMFSPANLQQVDLGVAGQNFGNMVSSQNGVGGNSTNYTTNSDNHETHIHVEQISLDCNNLTKQESRQILYDALDGLYTGGV